MFKVTVQIRLIRRDFPVKPSRFSIISWTKHCVDKYDTINDRNNPTISSACVVYLMRYHSQHYQAEMNQIYLIVLH